MKKLLLCIIGLMISGCSSMPSIVDRGAYKVDTTHPSQSQNERVRFLIFHYTAVDDAESLRLLTHGSASAHYLIPSQPTNKKGKPIVLELVPEGKRAWHAGLSDWNGRSNLNDSSIGVEIVNLGFTHETPAKRWYPFNDSQIDLLVRMSKDIIQRYGIKPDDILGHSDIAPTRKYDPGPLFPWQQLAAQGIGAWPDEATVTKYLHGRLPSDPASVATLQSALAKYGYKIAQSGILDSDTRRTISAFQMHFRSENISGNPDAQTEAIALALVEKYRGKP